MKTKISAKLLLSLGVLIATGCSGKPNPKSEAPPPTKIELAPSAGTVQVDHPEQFPLVTAISRPGTSSLNVTGVVAPDIARMVPVISLASGRVVAIYARLGDEVKKGQLLFTVQSADISQAFSDYRKAVADEVLARAELNRSQLLYGKGAISKSALEIAQDTEDKAAVDVETAKQHLKLLGSNIHQPSGAVNVYAPISGVIVEQNITNAAGVRTLDNSPNLFTIANLSDVWIVCDVYEDDLSQIGVGQNADIHLNAYPGKVLHGKVSEIDPILDPNLRTAKVRVQVDNPGFLKVGMFVTATFHGKQEEMHAVVPASAILHLHDRDWVYLPASSSRFRRVSVTIGDVLPGNTQEILSGIQPGQQVVSNALELESTVNP
ncbi:MAG TPA: efflux RND transporter periplasmic adaptor subunit [Acidobacteriaceae bacterium]|nr:efflux RND transporter periplasmic adaptor subunit [Acidobacteriaceae bacterium]